RTNTIVHSIRAHNLFSPPYVSKQVRQVVVAIGPEGGWEDSEVAAFAKRGFLVTSLSDRVLRTDIAVNFCVNRGLSWWIDVFVGLKCIVCPQ
ncbi:RsmE family RNA methyltransferase, partial [archaeon]